MLVDEVKSDALTERAAARQQLADAIAGVDDARARLAQARAAVESGWDRMITAGNRLDALKAELPQLSSALPADAVLSALTHGSNTETRSPRAVAESEIAALEGSREQLRRAIETGEREVEARKRAVDDARLRAHRAAVGVLKASGAPERLMSGLEALQEQVVRRRVALRFLAAFKAIPQDEVAAVEALLSANRELPGLPMQSGDVDWRGHPTHADWYRALALLERDADARLPA
jgi:chromosome segregation ATPase